MTEPIEAEVSGVAPTAVVEAWDAWQVWHERSGHWHWVDDYKTQEEADAKVAAFVADGVGACWVHFTLPALTIEAKEKPCES